MFEKALARVRPRTKLTCDRGAQAFHSAVKRRCCPRSWRPLIAPLRIGRPEPQSGPYVKDRRAPACIANRQEVGDHLARVTWLPLRPAARQPRRAGLGEPDLQGQPGNSPRYADWTPRARLRAPVPMPTGPRLLASLQQCTTEATQRMSVNSAVADDARKLKSRAHCLQSLGHQTLSQLELSQLL